MKTQMRKKVMKRKEEGEWDKARRNCGKVRTFLFALKPWQLLAYAILTPKKKRDHESLQVQIKNNPITKQTDRADVFTPSQSRRNRSKGLSEQKGKSR